MSICVKLMCNEELITSGTIASGQKTNRLDGESTKFKQLSLMLVQDPTAADLGIGRSPTRVIQ